VTLRAAKWEDLDAVMTFANELVEEQRKDPTFGTLLDGPVTREKEARWLADKLVAVEGGQEVSVVAEIGGKLVANSEAVLGRLSATAKNGYLATSVARGYRGMGIRSQMIKCLIDLSIEEGLESLELRVLSTNPRASGLYKRHGFRQAGVLEKKVRGGRKSIDLLIMTCRLSSRPSKVPTAWPSPALSIRPSGVQSHGWVRLLLPCAEGLLAETLLFVRKQVLLSYEDLNRGDVAHLSCLCALHLLCADVDVLHKESAVP